MTNASTPAVAAGWYPDPAGSARSRWWDGTAWTEHYYDAASAVPTPLKAPEGTKVYNVWIWLAVFLPYVTLPLLFTLDFGSLFGDLSATSGAASTQAQLALMTSPGYLAMTVAGWLTTAGAIFAGYRDWKALQQAGVPKPFHWAFSFFTLGGYPVYVIGRAVVTKRRTGHGSAVLWAAIGMLVLSVVVVIAWTATIIGTVMQQVANTPGLYN